MSSRKNNCLVCGTPILNDTAPKPRTYCSPNCADFNKFKTAMLDRLLLISFTKDSRSLIRGEFFRISNSISIGTFTKDIQSCMKI